MQVGAESAPAVARAATSPLRSACALLLLPVLLAALWLFARPVSAAVAPAAPSQQGSLTLNMTVGTTDACDAGGAITVQVGDTVYVCYQATNNSSGAGALTFTSHFLADANAVPFNGPFTETLAPGATSAIRRVSFTITQTVTRNDIWVATADSTQVQATDSVTITAEDPQVTVGLTVGREADECGADNTIAAPTGIPLHFCITIVNTGDVALTTHAIALTGFTATGTVRRTLVPNDTLRITASQAASLGLTSLTLSSLASTLTPALTVTSTTQSGFSAAPATAGATLTLGTPATALVATINTTESCPAASQTAITVVVNTPVYYCLRLTNTGNVVLTQHTISVSAPAKTAVFNTPLAPGATVIISNATLVAQGQAAIFGPVAAATSGSTSFSVISAAAGGFSTTSTASATVTANAPTATPTATPTPQPTVPTATPFPTWTPWPTLSPTPSWTPTWTLVPPTPTETPSWALSNLATPTPRPPGFDPLAQAPPTDPFATPDPFGDGNFLPTPDFTATLIAQQTVDAAFMGQSPLDTPGFGPGFDSPLATPDLAAPVSPLAPPDDAAAALAATQAAQGVEATLTAAAPTPEPTSTPTITPTPTATIRPLAISSAPDAGAMTGIFAEVLRSTAAAAGLIFFVLGVMIFFGVAGLVAGSSFRWGDRNRYRLYQMQEGERDPTDAARPPDGDDQWPASLP